MTETESTRAWAKGWRRGMYGARKDEDTGTAMAEPCPFPDGELKAAWTLGHIKGCAARDIVVLPEKNRKEALRRELGRR